MPRNIDRTDSFNSSGATIVPERESDIRSTTRSSNHPNAISSLSSARVLMPQDTLGRELDEALRGQEVSPRRSRRNKGGIDGGGRGALGGSSFLEFESAIRDFHQLPAETQSQTNLETYLSQSNPDFAALLTNPSTSATDVLAQLQVDHPEAFRPQGAHQIEPFRPESAHSHRSSVSVSEYSFATTEMDTDEADALDLDAANSRPGPQAVDVAALRASGLSWDMRGMEVDGDIKLGQGSTATGRGGNVRGGRGKGNGAAAVSYPTPASYTDGQSPPVTMSGVIRGPSHDDEDARLKRLEHRRQINRKSAQKHRLRRREELDMLQQDIAQKDAKIAQLEKDLAVEKSRTAQLQEFIDRTEARRNDDSRKAARRW